MPKRTDISHVLVIGSGPIVIGQACEFDYSGTQACRVLRDEGLRVSLVNSNPATIMTDPEFADATYIEPITAEFVEKVIAEEQALGHPIQAVLATLGGQTALNTAVALHERGVLEKYGVELIGADIDAIQRGEDRQLFKDICASVGAETPRSRVCKTMEEVRDTVAELGLPVVIRPSFTMGGLGSGMAHTPDELERLATVGLDESPVTEVLIEESVLGWKEYELELMRDRNDNVVVICSIENIDPMGVHTGDSVTVAPAMTLTDREYQHMRDVGIDVLRAVGVETGGCNIQFAINPQTGRMVVIEMNPRVSRSSALASKATGFPIAKIAARLAIGYTLDEIQNDITGETPASFEPTLDYVVVKVPRFAFEKFPGADPTLTTTMKSVGEAMSIGRNFSEALNKALRSMETKDAGFWTRPDPEGVTLEDTLKALERGHDGRLYTVERALRLGASVEQVHEASGIDPWFIDQIAALGELREEIVDAAVLDEALLRRSKRAGLSDRQIASLRPELAGEDGVRILRHRLKVRPVFKTVDTCAAEFAALTPYHYSAYESDPAAETEVLPQREKPKVLILGSGPNRIGQGIEFDYSCVHAAMELRRAGFETVMVNCNPETVSTELRHLRPPVLRAADVRGRAGGRALRARVRHGRRRHRPAGRADPARAGAAAGRRRRAGGRHLARGHPPGRGPRRVRRGAHRGRPARAQVRHRHVVPAGQADRRRDRLPGAGAALVRARRPRHGDRLRRGHAGRLHRPRHRGVARAPGPGRPVPRRRHRDRRGRPVRRRAGLHRRRHGAHRGGRHPLRRLLVRAAADNAGPQRHGGRAPLHRGHRPRRRRAWPAERAVRAQGRRAVRAGGQPPRVADGAVRVQGDGGAAGQGRGPHRAGRHHRRTPRGGRAAGQRRRRRDARRLPGRGEGGGPAVPPLPHAGGQGRGLAARAGDEVHRRGHGRGLLVRQGLRQVPDRLLRLAADQGPGVRVGGQPGQAGHGVPGQAAGRPGLRDPGHHRDRGGAAPQRCRLHGGAQALRGRGQHRGEDPGRRGGHDHEHPVRQPRPSRGRLRDPDGGGGAGHPVHHHRFRGCRGRARHRGPHPGGHRRAVAPGAPGRAEGCESVSELASEPFNAVAAVALPTKEAA
ncbi:carbamoyl-phosphate synthase large subunit [Kutzneria sp. 744]|nr:carbamoyl-phosphate synthase large subunit [Kutzneria sp. 744]